MTEFPSDKRKDPRHGERENDIAVTRPQEEFPCWSKGRNIMSMTRKSKEKEQSIPEAKILGFLMPYLAEACSLYHKEGWQLPSETADQEFPKCQPVSYRQKTNHQSVDS